MTGRQGNKRKSTAKDDLVHDDGSPEDNKASGLKNTLHGNIFQLKLLMWFIIRAINLGFEEFELDTENEKSGGKFDDLIFKFKIEEKSPKKSVFLQAKHKQNDNEVISIGNLLNKSEGDFSLIKYFTSYRNSIKKNSISPSTSSQTTCVIATNIGFHHDLASEGSIYLK